MSTQQSALRSIAQAVELATGQRPNIATIRRWYKKGISGVRLEVQYCQGKYVTSIDAVKRFIETSTAAKMARFQNPVILDVNEIVPVSDKHVDAAVAKFHAMAPANLRTSTKRLKPARNRKV